MPDPIALLHGPSTGGWNTRQHGRIRLNHSDSFPDYLFWSSRPTVNPNWISFSRSRIRPMPSQRAALD